MSTATQESETADAAPADDDTKPAEPGNDGGNDDESGSRFAEFISRTDTAITVTFRHRKFTVPKLRGEWPTRAMQIFQRGQMELFPDAVELMFGPTQWDEFNDVAPLIKDFWEFLPIFAEAVGLKPVVAADSKAATK